MPNEVYYLVSSAATRKQKNAERARPDADLVWLDDRRPRETWRRLDTIVARLGLLARSVDTPVEIIVHPPRWRAGDRGIAP